MPLDIRLFPILESLGMIPRNRIVSIRTHGVHARNRYSCRHETLLWFTKSDDYQFHLEPIRVPQKYPNKTYWKGPKQVHPCQFPEDMLERVILATTEPQDVVLDPYVGSGTTAVVAKRLGRHYIAVELKGEYAAIAEDRLRGTPDPQGNFPNLRTLREHAERNGLRDLSGYRFPRQKGAMPSSSARARIQREEEHLQSVIDRLGTEAQDSAHKRAERQRRETPERG